MSCSTLQLPHSAARSAPHLSHTACGSHPKCVQSLCTLAREVCTYCCVCLSRPVVDMSQYNSVCTLQRLLNAHERCMQDAGFLAYFHMHGEKPIDLSIVRSRLLPGTTQVRQKSGAS